MWANLYVLLIKVSVKHYFRNEMLVFVIFCIIKIEICLLRTEQYRIWLNREPLSSLNVYQPAAIYIN